MKTIIFVMMSKIERCSLALGFKMFGVLYPFVISLMNFRKDISFDVLIAI